MRWTMARPRPLPRAKVPWNGWKMPSSSSWGMPTPSSSTSRRPGRRTRSAGANRRGAAGRRRASPAGRWWRGSTGPGGSGPRRRRTRRARRGRPPRRAGPAGPRRCCASRQRGVGDGLAQVDALRRPGAAGGRRPGTCGSCRSAAPTRAARCPSAAPARSSSVSSSRSTWIEPRIDASGLRISWAMPAAISPTAASRCLTRASRSSRFTSGHVLERDQEARLPPGAIRWAAAMPISILRPSAGGRRTRRAGCARRRGRRRAARRTSSGSCSTSPTWRPIISVGGEAGDLARPPG